MGFPINSYTVLQALSDKKHSWHSYIREYFDKYDLVSFILHDPILHKNFGSALDHEFRNLDRLTGGRMAFLALTNPGEDWLKTRTGQNNLYHYLEKFRSKYFYEIENIHTPLLNPVSENHSATVLALAAQLGIPHSHLPVIVYTRDLSGNKYDWLKTSAEGLLHDFARLSNIAHGEPEKAPYSPRLKWSGSLAGRLFRVIGQLPLVIPRWCKGGGPSANEIAQKIERCHMEVARNSESEPIRKEGFAQQLNGELQDLKISMVHNSNEEDFSEFDDKATGFIFTFGQLERDGGRLCPEFFRHLDHYSRVLMHSVSCLEPIWVNQMGMTDHSALGCAYGKMFENEINQGLVNYFRHRHQIPMPKYHSSWCPNTRALVRVNQNHTVDLNSSRGDGNWKPPTLGDSYWVSRREFEDSPDEFPVAKENARSFLNEFDSIKNLRNAVMHPGPFGIAELNRLKNHISQMDKMAFFLENASIRQRLSQ